MRLNCSPSSRDKFDETSLMGSGTRSYMDAGVFRSSSFVLYFHSSWLFTHSGKGEEVGYWENKKKEEEEAVAEAEEGAGIGEKRETVKESRHFPHVSTKMKGKKKKKKSYLFEWKMRGKKIIKK